MIDSNIQAPVSSNLTFHSEFESSYVRVCQTERRLRTKINIKQAFKISLQHILTAVDYDPVKYTTRVKKFPFCAFSEVRVHVLNLHLWMQMFLFKTMRGIIISSMRMFL
jgi:hypothetical protein